MKDKILRILFSIFLVSLIFAVGCEDDSESRGTDLEAEGNVEGGIILIDGDGNAIRQNTVEEEMLHEEGGEE
jgi:hypothetical protein